MLLAIFWPEDATEGTAESKCPVLKAGSGTAASRRPFCPWKSDSGSNDCPYLAKHGGDASCMCDSALASCSYLRERHQSGQPSSACRYRFDLSAEDVADCPYLKQHVVGHAGPICPCKLTPLQALGAQSNCSYVKARAAAAQSLPAGHPPVHMNGGL